MKKHALSIWFWGLALLPVVFSQDVDFSFDLNNSDPTVSVVNIYAAFDGTGNSNAIGYTLTFYYDNTEATTSVSNFDFSPSTALGWLTAGNTSFSNATSTNPLVPIVFTHRVEMQVFDGNFVGTNFSTTPTLITKLTFNKTIGIPEYGGEVYAGATADTDPAIRYNDNNIDQWFIEIAGARSGVLPLTLIAFDAKKFNDRSSILTWTTSSEINTSHFMVQRSIDKRTWTNVGRVEAHGNSQIIRNYEYFDENVFDGTSPRLIVYYRLLAFDIDGQSKNSPIESVVFGTGANTGREILAYPNPASDGIQVEWDIDKANQPTSIELYDIDGKLVYTAKVDPNSNQEYIDFGFTNIQSGLYLLRLVNGDVPIENKQIVVQR
ncbi:MAG: T9SS type A sorting domain-containing protein [Saprospiraceae bacterium]